MEDDIRHPNYSEFSVPQHNFTVSFKQACLHDLIGWFRHAGYVIY